MDLLPSRNRVEETNREVDKERLYFERIYQGKDDYFAKKNSRLFVPNPNSSQKHRDIREMFDQSNKSLSYMTNDELEKRDPNLVSLSHIKGSSAMDYSYQNIDSNKNNFENKTSLPPLKSGSYNIKIVKDQKDTSNIS
jgi:hypothetical protein